MFVSATFYYYKATSVAVDNILLFLQKNRVSVSFKGLDYTFRGFSFETKIEFPVFRVYDDMLRIIPKYAEKFATNNERGMEIFFDGEISIIRKPFSRKILIRSDDSTQIIIRGVLEDQKRIIMHNFFQNDIEFINRNNGFNLDINTDSFNIQLGDMTKFFNQLIFKLDQYNDKSSDAMHTYIKIIDDVEEEVLLFDVEKMFDKHNNSGTLLFDRVFYNLDDINFVIENGILKLSYTYKLQYNVDLHVIVSDLSRFLDKLQQFLYSSYDIVDPEKFDKIYIDMEEIPTLEDESLNIWKNVFTGHIKIGSKQGEIENFSDSELNAYISHNFSDVDYQAYLDYSKRVLDSIIMNVQNNFQDEESYALLSGMFKGDETVDLHFYTESDTLFLNGIPLSELFFSRLKSSQV
ncbi:MAG: hypothetical protein P857_1071 [Candidatus Xenolissoclinum pacificiensis L6]|uniref:Uncharacterized protein n=1 Tax=Candidatus Xenolissoclinum pacificiensis L6 TaxID=1401685 RepID=W2V0E6_9RICK|nr:MAG: hypothetical protein P857_1071 [Candidatus Xenolissoclinum pacificiensis L6]